MSFYRVRVAEHDAEEAHGPKSLMDHCDKGERFDWPASSSVACGGVGKMYDWIPGRSCYPFVADVIKSRLEPLVGESVQWHGPFSIRERVYYLLNCISVIDCALPGSSSNQTFIDSKAVGELLIFRPKGFTRHLLCNQAFRDDCVKNGDTGVRFGRIKEDGWEDFPF
jgi:hypothetical protein